MSGCHSSSRAASTADAFGSRPRPVFSSAFSQIYISHFHLHFAVVGVGVGVVVGFAVASMAHFPLFYVALRVLFIICTALAFSCNVALSSKLLLSKFTLKYLIYSVARRPLQKIYRKFGKNVGNILNYLLPVLLLICLGQTSSN